jgi:hypothetical protein
LEEYRHTPLFTTLPVPLALGHWRWFAQIPHGSVQVSRRRKTRKDPGHLFGIIQAGNIGVVFLWMHIFRIANEERNGKNPRDGFTGPLRRGEALPWNEAGRRLQNYSQEETTLLQRGESAGQIPS